MRWLAQRSPVRAQVRYPYIPKHHSPTQQQKLPPHTTLPSASKQPSTHCRRIHSSPPTPSQRTTNPNTSLKARNKKTPSMHCPDHKDPPCIPQVLPTPHSGSDSPPPGHNKPNSRNSTPRRLIPSGNTHTGGPVSLSNHRNPPHPHTYMLDRLSYKTHRTVTSTYLVQLEAEPRALMLDTYAVALLQVLPKACHDLPATSPQDRPKQSTTSTRRPTTQFIVTGQHTTETCSTATQPNQTTRLSSFRHSTFPRRRESIDTLRQSAIFGSVWVSQMLRGTTK